ncbi:hypothetical protein HMPREF0202_02697 [Cetobacterium somerae ATCC BAA-474]|uniref:Uncharacterized protein n=1 Tax=Cetobacterium somerae ATCC BAA-474 TaxID=1319815 RepID=U7V335_9FUSO|nr:hypothetical protein HMPREF0202_02697 [Cetobacterium somerae ATCC BAA-474]
MEATIIISQLYLCIITFTTLTLQPFYTNNFSLYKLLKPL